MDELLQRTNPNDSVLLLNVLWRKIPQSHRLETLINSGSLSLENHPLPILKSSYFKLPPHSSSFFFTTSSLISAEPTFVFRGNSSNVRIPPTTWALSRCTWLHPRISVIPFHPCHPCCLSKVQLPTLPSALCTQGLARQCCLSLLAFCT